VALVREDIHIHARAAEIYERVTAFDALAAWLPPSIAAPREEDGALAFRLRLPLHGASEARLAVADSDPPSYVSLEAPNDARDRGALDALRWALHQEAERNVHVTLEVEYRPAGGLLGSLLEAAIHAPLRRQALRDTLWRLKQVAEGRGPDSSELRP
jgi:hypothetical protein